MNRESCGSCVFVSFLRKNRFVFVIPSPDARIDPAYNLQRSHEDQYVSGRRKVESLVRGILGRDGLDRGEAGRGEG